MEYTENGCVNKGFDRKLSFPKIKWLTKTRFEKIIKINQNIQIHPCLNEHVERIDKRIFIGKTIPRQPPPFAVNSIAAIANLPGHLTFINSENIGNVLYENGIWKLRITFRGQALDLEEDFVVLNIPDFNSFYWSSNVENSNLDLSDFTFNNKDVPNNALKAAVDQIDSRYAYIGRTIERKSDFDVRFSAKRPKYYSNGWCLIDDEKEGQAFGRIDQAYRLMFAPFKNIEIGHDRFETLCLRASPASLKMLCRSAIRSYVNYSQKNIKKLQNVIPETLVNYLKYSNHLKVGEMLLKDEKLVHDNDEYELVFDRQNGDLVCKRLDDDNNELKILKIIAKNVDLIAVHRFYAVFFNKEKNFCHFQHLIYDIILEYKLFFEWDVMATQLRFLA